MWLVWNKGERRRLRNIIEILVHLDFTYCDTTYHRRKRERGEMSQNDDDDKKEEDSLWLERFPHLHLALNTPKGTPLLLHFPRIEN